MINVNERGLKIYYKILYQPKNAAYKNITGRETVLRYSEEATICTSQAV